MQSTWRGPGKMQFSTWQGLGNKYIVLHQEEIPFELTPERVRLLCNRDFGIGSDGILRGRPAPGRRPLRPAHLQPRRQRGRDVRQRRAHGRPQAQDGGLDHRRPRRARDRRRRDRAYAAGRLQRARRHGHRPVRRREARPFPRRRHRREAHDRRAHVPVHVRRRRQPARRDPLAVAARARAPARGRSGHRGAQVLSAQGQRRVRRAHRRPQRQDPRVGAGGGGDAGLRHRRDGHGRGPRAHRHVREPGDGRAARAASSRSRSPPTGACT